MTRDAGRRSAGVPPAGRCRAWLALLAVAIASPLSATEATRANRPLLLSAARAGAAVVVVGERGVILRSTDAARTWHAADAGTFATLTGVAFGDATTGWAVGHDGLILTSHDGGVTWQTQWRSKNLQDSLLDVLAIDGNHAIAIGAFALCLATDDGGRTWLPRKPIEQDYHLNRITRGPSGHLYIAGEHGTLLRSRDKGATWSRLTAPYEGSFYGVLPLSNHELLVYGLRGRVFHSDDDGASWLPVATDETALLAAAVRTHDGLIVLAGNARHLLVSRDPRRSFAPRDVGGQAAIAELLLLPDDSVLTVGEDGAARIDGARISPDFPGARPAPR